MDLVQQMVVYDFKAHYAPSHIRYYLCLCYYERVSYRNGGSNRVYFAHLARSDYTTWCEKRVDLHGLRKTVNHLLVKSLFHIQSYKNGNYYQLHVWFRPTLEIYYHFFDCLIKSRSEYFFLSFKFYNFIDSFYSIVLNYNSRYFFNTIGCSDGNVILLLNHWGRSIDYLGDKGTLFKERDCGEVCLERLVHYDPRYYVFWTIMTEY